MATILQPIDFTDKDAKDAVSSDATDYVNGTGDNVYLALGNEYYNKLLRDYGIDSSDTGLADPPIFQVKKVMICFVEMEIFGDLIDDSRATFEGQETLIDKFQNKYDLAKECHEKWLSQLDENAFYDTAKGTDSPVIGRFGRG